MQHAGEDMAEVMNDEVLHAHSDSAFAMLEDYVIGELLPDEGVDLLAAHAAAAAAPSAAAAAAYPGGHVPYGSAPKRPFIDLSRPMLPQIFFGRFSKQFYLEQVHIPRQVKGSAPLFPYRVLEPLSLTPWWVIPTVYIPIVLYCLAKSAAVGASTLGLAGYFGTGVFVWTLIEYSLHRFVFHIDDYLPDHPILITLHFLLHGVHHFLPMDRMRLVMPPALGLTLASPFVWVFLNCFTPPAGYGVMAGAFFGFQSYDLIHYYLHHGRPAVEHLREMKSYHLDHHYKNANLGYGITSKLWDIVFGTQL
ncbi:fatty acid alpha-hydroxylase [Cladochytrium tenue]|nr:fatty acid alpha-hydroxylase [Cladochytrium tenue]